MSTVGNKVFKDLKADEVDEEVTTVGSLCLSCHGQGETRLLLTRIPFYKEVGTRYFLCFYNLHLWNRGKENHAVFFFYIR